MALGAAAALLAACTGSSGDRSSEVAPATHSGTSTPVTPLPPPPPGWVVSLGDSYISGEGARWAGNSIRAWRRVDALGPDVYLGVASRRERQPGCHQARVSVADLHFAALRGKNLACSGATTSSSGSGPTFKPGVDDFSARRGEVGQVRQLRRFAASHSVVAVVISISGNNFGFGSVLASCVGQFLFTVQSQPQHCSADPAVTGHFSPSRVTAVATEIAASLRRVAVAMRSAGHTRGGYRILVLTYPAPLPPARQLRYPETLRARATVGGCPLFDADVTWAATALAAINSAVRAGVRRSGVPEASVLDLSSAFVGHRLCERGVGQLEETGLPSWRAPGAVDRLEWVNKLSLAPARFSEAMHPNYWGMLAQRACVRLALRRGGRRSLRCVPAGGDQRVAAPRMVLR